MVGIDEEPFGYRGEPGDGRRGGIGIPPAGEQGASAAVAENVGDFLRPQSRGDGDVSQARSLCGPGDFQERRVVPHQHRDAVAVPESA